MIFNQFKTIWRRNKKFTAINIFGLALGMFCVILISLWINYETGFDKFHYNYENLYRVVNNWGDEKDVCCPGALAMYMRNHFPDVKNACTYSVAPNIKLSHNEQKNWFTGGIADSSFFNMFSFNFLQGSKNNPFPEPNSAIITNETAIKLFGSTNPIGKPVKMEFEDMVLDLTVSGIIENAPKNSSLQFDFLVTSAIAPGGYFSWNNNWPEVFALLNKKSSVTLLNDNITNLAKLHDKEAINTFELKSFKSEHLQNINGSGLIVYVRLFGLFALIILFIACFNFINLSTAQTTDRQKEIGIKKVMGSSRKKLQKQFMIEVILISLIAIILGLLMAWLFLPLINDILITNIAFEINQFVLLTLLGTVVVSSLLSGIYPALYLSSLSPLSILKNNNIIRKGRKPFVRQVLVISQFTFTLILLTCLIGLYKQLNFIKNTDLGFKKEGIVIVSLQGKTQTQTGLIKENLLNNPNIIQVTASSFHPVMQDGETSFVNWKDKMNDNKVSAKFNYVDYDYIKTFDISMKEGRFFSGEYADKNTLCFIINEKLAKKMGFDNPIGKQMALLGDNYGTIIGVMNNFHNEALYNDIREYTIMLGNSFNYLSVRMNTNNMAQTIDYIKKELLNIDPSYLFSYQFLDKEIASKYSREALIGKLITIFTVLSLFISLLGLFGLVLFTIKKQVKEIGIRKVNGAKTTDILIKLNGDFVRMILISILLAFPLSFFIIKQWLLNFAYKTNLSFWIFILSGVVILLISLLIISLQSRKYAFQNPSDILKYE